MGYEEGLWINLGGIRKELLVHPHVTTTQIYDERLRSSIKEGDSHHVQT